jgi:hypothetical protein
MNKLIRSASRVFQKSKNELKMQRNFPRVLFSSTEVIEENLFKVKESIQSEILKEEADIMDNKELLTFFNEKGWHFKEIKHSRLVQLDRKPDFGESIRMIFMPIQPTEQNRKLSAALEQIESQNQEAILSRFKKDILNMMRSRAKYVLFSCLYIDLGKNDKIRLVLRMKEENFEILFISLISGSISEDAESFFKEGPLDPIKVRSLSEGVKVSLNDFVDFIGVDADLSIRIQQLSILIAERQQLDFLKKINNLIN